MLRRALPLVLNGNSQNFATMLLRTRNNHFFKSNINHIRNFHVTHPKCTTTSGTVGVGVAGIATIVLLRPVIKVTAMIFGRAFRKWWRSVPFKERLRRIRAGIYKHRLALSLVSTGVISSWGVFVYLHLEEVPIVKRKRFTPVTPYQFKKITDAEEELVCNFCAIFVFLKVSFFSI